MRINELLVESQQLDEGPFGTAVGKAVGGLAKGVGAVAGGVAGMGKAFKKGFSSGKATVAGDPDPNDEPAAAEKPAAGGAQQPALTGGPTAGLPPAAEPVGGATAQPSAGDVNKAGPAGTAAAKPLQGAAKIAADKTASATAGQDQAAAGQTMYATVKANIDKLDKKGKQRILQLLQKSMAAPAGGAAPAPAPAGGAAAPAAKPAAAAPERVAPPGEEPAAGGAMGAMANQLGGKPANTMANAPVSATNSAKPGNPNLKAPASGTPAPQKKAVKPDADAATQAKVAAAPNGYDQDTGKPIQAPAADPAAAPAADPAAAAPVKQRTGGRVKGQLSQDPRAVKRREANAAKNKQQAQAPDQAEIDADRERMMGNFTDSVQRHKQRMVAEAFSRGEISLFRKR